MSKGFIPAARPIVGDVERAAVDAGAVLTERTAGIMPVHRYGHPADMTAMTALAQEHGVQLFEDAAQAHSARWQGVTGRSSPSCAVRSCESTLPSRT